MLLLGGSWRYIPGSTPPDVGDLVDIHRLLLLPEPLFSPGESPGQVFTLLVEMLHNLFVWCIQLDLETMWPCVHQFHHQQNEREIEEVYVETDRVQFFILCAEDISSYPMM